MVDERYHNVNQTFTMSYTDRQRQSYATKLRHHQTPSEKMMWGLWFLGFRAQVVTPSNYVADYYHRRSRVAVEIDGGVHEYQRAKDRQRDSHHRGKQIYTIRLSNELVSKHRWLAYLKVIILASAWQLWRWLKL